jgi:hypothetical protein
VSALGALTTWIGWDPTPGSTSTTTAEHDASGSFAAADVVYELLALAGRGFRPPRYLTASPADPDDGGAADDRATTAGALRRSWSVEYRRIAETAPAGPTPHAIYLLGVDPPEGASDAELAVFNDFYTSVHLVEVAERRHALRAERYERERVLRAPAKGAPRYLAVYEVDEAGAAQRRHVGPPYSKGPDVWQRHTTPWRLWYRLVTR